GDAVADERADLGDLPEVGQIDARPATLPLDLVSHLVEELALAPDECDVCAGVRQLDRDRAPDAAPAAGDDRHLAGQVDLAHFCVSFRREVRRARLRRFWAGRAGRGPPWRA